MKNLRVRVKTSPTEKKVVVRQEEEQKDDNEASHTDNQVDEDEGDRERRIKKKIYTGKWTTRTSFGLINNK